MKLAEQIVQQLQQAGVRRIYGIVGDSLNPVVDAVRRTGGSKAGGIDWIHVRHEEAAAFAAGADAQLTGELVACAGSCGPGNLHLINGLYDANRSHAPVVAIASHIPSSQIGQGYFQETHPDRIFTECSVYSELVSTPAQSPRVVAAAIRHAVGAPGVAVITLPGDIADEEATADAPLYVPVEPGVLQPPASVVQRLADAINDSDKVALFVGAGAAGAHDEVIELAEKIGAPVGHTLRGKEVVQYDNPNDVGMTGLLGYGAAAEGLDEADLLIMLGTDFPYDQFLPDDVTTAQVDTDATVIGRRTAVDLPVHGDVRATLATLLPLVEAKRKHRFLDQMHKRHDKLMNKAVGAYTKNVEHKQPIHPEFAASILDQVAADDAIFTADTGMGNVWTARYLNPLGTRRLIGSFLHGSMANALPQALGAQLAYPDRQVVSVSGDGGLAMLLGELLTVRMYDLPIKVVLFNNSTLGMVKLEMLVDKLPDFGVDVPEVDYAAIAQAMGWHSVRITDPRKLEAEMAAAFAHDGPALIDVVTDPLALSIPPKISSSQVFGFATAMSKIVLNGGAGEAISMARSNLRNIPR
ncbi:pyruvate dehydrogenase (quinone) [Barrientosiimonas humi]|uniref:Pyruvate dehydrogenase (Quinone) n=2 Tax=Barrientosiimonas TaxID=1535207 RepID=A0A542XFN7_9MICO|nr:MULTISPECIES: pyruvate dehydrogenase [Barrientosiimonas]TQL34630.1 pyruvate dehydrogenase (quinone) [Barrientosiimonas humi]BDZ59740.1 pyruvate dehydrogenase [Barrientosiimonas endolithica]CAG7574620.1 Pyruvate dehydrogenase [ubiquinone] [Barrientosiimonas humi]